MAAIRIIFISLWWISAAVASASDDVHKIVGGHEAVARQFPYQVSLQWLYVGHFCGGTVYSRSVVVTAAHCCHVFDPEQEDSLDISYLEVQTGLLSLSDPGYFVQTRSVRDIVMHPDFDAETLMNDVCLLHLDRELSFSFDYTTAVPGGLTDDPAEADNCVVTGWGVTNTSDPETISDVLMYAEVDVLDDGACRQAYEDYPGYDDDAMVCAGVAGGGRDSCQADSGGGLVCDGALVGVVSFGNGCGQSDYPGVYAEVYHYADWIEEKASDLMDSGGGEQPAVTACVVAASPAFSLAVILNSKLKP